MVKGNSLPLKSDHAVVRKEVKILQHKFVNLWEYCPYIVMRQSVSGVPVKMK